MNIFISGTDTNIGKTLISSWLCMHGQYDYFKPIQTGCIEDRDSQTVFNLSGVCIHPESYLLKNPLSPHLAAQIENINIDLNHIHLPKAKRLIVEGAGGLMVPINDKAMMIDLIVQFKLPVILIASTRIGTINHTLLSIEALRTKQIPLLGVVMSGQPNQDNAYAIQQYGQCELLAQFPLIKDISSNTLRQIPLTKALHDIMSAT